MPVALQKKKKKKKGPKKGKGSKKPTRALMEIYYELVELGIVKKCPKVKDATRSVGFWDGYL